MEPSAGCEICGILLEAANAVLQDDYDLCKKDCPNNNPRYYYRKAKKWPLGEKGFAASSGCNAHVDFLQALHPSFNDLQASQLETLELRLGAESLVVKCEAPGPGAHIQVISTTNHRGPGVGRLVDRSYIDLDLVRQWRLYCDTHHGEQCSKKYIRDTMSPVWLLDTQQECLVPGSEDMPYVALSYVWGRVDMLKTQKANIESHQIPGVFARGMGYLPQTIRDAMGVLPLVGERYLWVDALCIVQDDDDSMRTHLQHMAGIYENAEFTIVANDGDRANYGLRGIRGLSQPRVLKSELKLTDTISVTGCQNRKTLDTPWASRAWTLQEALFSRRKLHFTDNSLHWACQSNVYHEDVDTPLDLKFMDWSMLHGKGASNPEQELSWADLALDYPDIGNFKKLISHYSYRDFSYEEDVFSAFASTLNACQQRAFPRGFVQGIPVSFFDDCLVWRANLHGVRPRQPSNPSRQCPPSWTWAGWKTIPTYEYGNSEVCVKTSPMDEVYLNAFHPSQVIPFLKWYSCASPKAEWHEIEYQNEWYDFKRRYMGQKDDLPPGWRYERDTTDYNEGYVKRRSYFSSSNNDSNPLRPEDVFTPYCYVHELAPSVKFWHPVPFGDDLQAARQSTASDRYLCTRTQTARLWAARPHQLGEPLFRAPGKERVEKVNMFDIAVWVTTVLRDGQGQVVGELQVDTNDDRRQLDLHNGKDDEGERESPGLLCDLVAISRGFGRPEPMEPDNETYNFYNVLWVKWEDGIAYRRGIGRVKREVWEEMQKEDIDLILG